LKLTEISELLGLKKVGDTPLDDSVDIEYGYVCDLLSQVLAGAKPSSVWITVQSHMNIVGVASMAGIKAIIVSDGHNIPDEVVAKAEEEGIALFRCDENGFRLSGKLYERGIR
jgi:hypothetical protein